MSFLNNLFAEKSILGLVVHGSWISQFVLLVLLIMSSITWAVIFLKWIQYRKINGENQEFLMIFQKETKLDQIYHLAKEFELSPLAHIFEIGYKEVVQYRQKCQHQKQNSNHYDNNAEHCSSRLQRATERCISQHFSIIEKKLNMLATISSSAPFVGLFGTVLGIIDAFQNIGTTGVTSLAVVAPGISEALVATAAGLLAAIPALMAFNYFRYSSRLIVQSMRSFSLDLVNRIDLILT